MNQYPHHIGDFNTATRHLSRLERAMYRDMLDMYYDKEAPLDGSDFDLLAKRLLCTTPEEVAALQFLLNEYFEEVEGGQWRHDRCERELSVYRSKQEAAGVVKSNENTRQTRSRAMRAAIFSALRAAGIEVHWKATLTDARRLCREHGVAIPTMPTCHAPVTVTSHARHALDTANQNQNQNHIEPPNPPDGGASGSVDESGQGEGAPAEPSMGTAIALSACFPERRRTRLPEVAQLVTALERDGSVTGAQLLDAAARQAKRLAEDGGKASPSMLRWLRERRWLDTPPGTALDASDDWRSTRSSVEAMGVRLGIGAWDQQRHRLFADYERAVEAALAASVQVREPA